VESTLDPQVDNFIHVIISKVNCEGYKYIAAAYDHPPADPTDCLSVVIVLNEGYDEEELKKREVAAGPIDESIEFARPHVLDSPDVWELWR
jgi:hypothetical protein